LPGLALSQAMSSARLESTAARWFTSHRLDRRRNVQIHAACRHTLACRSVHIAGASCHRRRKPQKPDGTSGRLRSANLTEEFSCAWRPRAAMPTSDQLLQEPSGPCGCVLAGRNAGPARRVYQFRDPSVTRTPVAIAARAKLDWDRTLVPDDSGAARPQSTIQYGITSSEWFWNGSKRCECRSTAPQFVPNGRGMDASPDRAARPAQVALVCWSTPLTSQSKCSAPHVY
jgi:hypothetical protein